MHNCQDTTFNIYGTILQKADFFTVFWPTWGKAMKIASIQADNRMTGIYLINSDAFELIRCHPEEDKNNLLCKMYSCNHQFTVSVVLWIAFLTGLQATCNLYAKCVVSCKIQFTVPSVV